MNVHNYKRMIKAFPIKLLGEHSWWKHSIWKKYQIKTCEVYYIIVFARDTIFAKPIEECSMLIPAKQYCRLDLCDFEHEKWNDKNDINNIEYRYLENRLS